MIAIHSVVGADEVWGLLPRLKSAGRVRDPRPADREDRPVTRPATRSSSAGSTSPRVAARRPGCHAATTTRSSVAAPSRIRASARRSGRPSTTSGHAATRPSATPIAAVGGGRPDGRLVLDRADLVAARDALDPAVRRALDQAIDHVRRFAETQRPARPGRRSPPASRSSAAGRRSHRVGAYVPGGSAAYPSSLVMTVVPARVAGVDADRRRVAGRSRRARSTRSCSAPPACSRSTPSSSPVVRRRSAPWPTACPRPASSRSTGSSGRATPG